METQPRTASSYGVALTALTLGLFLCSATMVAAYVTFGLWPAVAIAVVGGFAMHGLSMWAGPALVEDDDVWF